MHFVVIDDIAIQRQLIVDKLYEVCQELEIPCDIALQTESWQEVTAYAVSAPADTVYLLDIELADEQNGIALRRELSSLDADGYIIYVSAYERYALECCQSHAFDFLLKPWTVEQLRACIRAVNEDRQRRSDGTQLSITIGSRTLYLQKEEILYLSKEHNNVTIHLLSGDSIQCRSSFSKLVSKLDDSAFVQCHKCYIVHERAIREFRWDDDVILLINGEELPISRRRVAALAAAYGGESRRSVCK